MEGSGYLNTSGAANHETVKDVLRMSSLVPTNKYVYTLYSALANAAGTKTKVEYSLSKNRPCIILVDTKELFYWGGLSNQHFIVVEASNGNYARVDGCASSTYGGEHQVPYTEIYQVLYEKKNGTSRTGKLYHCE